MFKISFLIIFKGVNSSACPIKRNDHWRSSVKIRSPCLVSVRSFHRPDSRYACFGRIDFLSNVYDAAARRPIFSVGGEIIPLKKSICILRDIIEWNYPLFDNQRTQKTNERGSQHSSPNKRQKRDELERIAEVRIEANEFPESTCDEKRWRKSSPSRFFKA